MAIYDSVAHALAAAEARIKELEASLSRAQERCTIAEHRAEQLQEALRRSYRLAAPGRSPRQPHAGD
jgi:hypothetical protein